MRYKIIPIIIVLLAATYLYGSPATAEGLTSSHTVEWNTDPDDSVPTKTYTLCENLALATEEDSGSDPYNRS